MRTLVVTILLAAALPMFGQRHRVIDPGVPRAIPITDVDPYFTMSGAQVTTPIGAHVYTISILALPGSDKYPRVYYPGTPNAELHVPVWRYRGRHWCTTQVLSVKIGLVATKATLDMSRFLPGDTIMIEDWLNTRFTISMDNVVIGQSILIPSEGEPKHIGVYQDCTE